MKIRKALLSDIEQILPLYRMARDFQRNVLNLIQWEDNYPSRSQLLEDIRNHGSYVVMEDNKLNREERIVGTFYLGSGPDRVYLPLKAHWENLDQIVTLHRIASHLESSGVGNYVFRWLQENFDHVMVDTHDQNEVMKHLINKHQFKYLGVVTLEKGGLRNTYEWVKGDSLC